MDRGPQSTLEHRIIIVGAASLQNKLLARLIGERTRHACEIIAAAKLDGVASVPGVLVLVDAADAVLQLPVIAAAAACSMAIINAEPGMAVDPILTAPGVKGVFFSDTTEDSFIKGIGAIFAGEYWLPRRVLCAHLERTRVPQKHLPSAATRLTRKETETLRLLASGNTTERIARELNVSPHTVKTHIYNLFRKIKVSNRVQAMRWAAQNIVSSGQGSWGEGPG